MNAERTDFLDTPKKWKKRDLDFCHLKFIPLHLSYNE
jgi:hypothetical protein